MRCLHMFQIKNRLNETKFVPCGSCLACRVNKKTFWQNRIAYDVVSANNKGFGSTFLGLSLEDSHLKDGLIHKEELQKFFKRFRKVCPYPMKHYSIGEYGDKGKRPHYHAILIGCPTEIAAPLARKAWNFGFTTADPVTSGRIRYVVDYLDCTSPYAKKCFEDLGLVPPFALNSNGIGESLFEAQHDCIMDTAHYVSRGKYFPVSEYWLNKLGVPISARKSFAGNALKRALDDYKLHGKNFSSFEAYAYDCSFQQQLAKYNAQINKLSPKYGRPMDNHKVFNPSKKVENISHLSMEVLK